MIPESDAALLSLSLDRNQPQPLHMQLASDLRRLILTGRIGPGSKLPSSRLLAQELSVSRVTVTTAIDQLVSEGYAEGRRGAGVFVAGDLPEQLLQAEPAAPATPARQPLAEPRPVRPFQAGSPDMSLFPHTVWARAYERVWRSPQPGLLANADPCGWAPLRREIASHLAAWRGLPCSPHQVIITSGMAEAAELLARALLSPGDVMLLEEPGYPLLTRAFGGASLNCVSVPVDTQGFSISEAVKHHDFPAAVTVTPSRQFPLGMTLPLARRLELLAWASETGGLVIEDDYDSEYRFEGQPLPAMMGLDDAECVIYVGSFSKVLSSAIRLGFMVLPDRLIEPVTREMSAIGPRASLVPQPVLADFMADGSLAAHIRRMRRAYARRQKALIAAGRVRLADFLDIEATPAGMHVIARLKPRLQRLAGDQQLAERCAGAGLTVRALSEFYAGKPDQQGLVLGFAAFDEDTLAGAVGQLAAVLEKV